MKKLLQEENGFTLVEMLVVLMIISVLLLIVVPNMSKNNNVAGTKGCEATVNLLQAQVHAYKLEKNEFPATLQKLKDDGYVDKTTCASDLEISYNNTTGTVTIKQTPPSAE